MPRTLHSLVGTARLGLDCVAGLVSVVERMHETIAGRAPAWSPRPARAAPGEPREQARRAHGPVAAGVYAGLRGAVRLAGRGLEVPLEAVATGSDDPACGEPGRATAWISALNGICGDHLETSGNPLAIPMGFFTAEGPVALDEPIDPCLSAGSRIVVLVHGLCLSERQWLRTRSGGAGDLGTRLRQELGYTALYLRYNTGRHISTNGRELSAQLERLLAAWPVRVESLTLVGHSMGGLVLRSASWYGAKLGHAWLERLRNVVCLGTPHHGAPLAKGGHWITAAFGVSPYAAPLALGRLRSAGIKDLRHGNLLDEDWQGQDPDALEPDMRQPVPLLEGVEYYFAAATLGRALAGRALGDLLVRTGSALGAHPDAQRRLPVRPENTRVFSATNHFDLLADPAVHDQIVAWLRGSPPRQP